MPSPRDYRRRCSHPVRQVMEFHPLGAVVGCVLCDSTFDMEEDEMQAWVQFSHTSTRGKDFDLYLLAHPEQIVEA